ncbi:hypothetical protein N9164_07280 [Draconibacterium sp.]|nr:hypothetical protein [Draconibacterium sp.]
MKDLLRFILIGLVTISISCVYPQKNDKQAISMLEEFYTIYNSAWSSNIDSATLLEKLDSLQQEYCTDSLRKKLKNLSNTYGLDHDLLINDYYADSTSLRTLSIVRDSSKDNCYVVTYIVNIEDPTNNPIEQKVTLYVTVVKEEEGYKIDDVVTPPI